MVGLSELIGSWGIRATVRPRWLCISFSLNVERSTPSSSTLPEAMLPLPGRSRMIARPDVVLPQPDSPTRPTHWPGSMSIEKLSTAVTNDLRVENLTWRFFTESSDGMVNNHTPLGNILWVAETPPETAYLLVNRPFVPATATSVDGGLFGPIVVSPPCAAWRRSPCWT